MVNDFLPEITRREHTHHGQPCTSDVVYTGENPRYVRHYRCMATDEDIEPERL